PDRLHAREREMGVIRQFLREYVCGRRPGSLYVSGAPGTGKTACLSRILLDCKDELAGSKTIVLNCMSLSSPQGGVFPAMAQQLGPPACGQPEEAAPAAALPAQGAVNGPWGWWAELGLTWAPPPLPRSLLVLDELDQLESKGQDVLYTLFEWPRLPGSRLVLVGLANALDLTDRSLARLGARTDGSPRLLHFPPYTREQLTAILQERLGQGGGGGGPSQHWGCPCRGSRSARHSGLTLLRRAVEVVELEVRSQTLLKPLPGGE
ncbi:Cell division control protein 6, partial [Aptenodytes forsteri]